MDKSKNIVKTKDFDSSSDTIIVTPEKSPVKNNMHMTRCVLMGPCHY